jgi:hypothetical protein
VHSFRDMFRAMNGKILRLSNVLLQFTEKGGDDCFDVIPGFVNCLFVFVLSRTSNFSAIWRLSP